MSKLAYVFPGQGSQAVGMLADLAAEHSVIQDTFAIASQALGYDLWELVQNNAEGKLNQTHITQPALLTASVALWELLKQQGATAPDYLAGHSLGEYSALVCAGVLSLADGVKLVEARGKFMQQAVPEGQGAMFAIIGLDDDKVIAACEQAAAETGNVVSAVNFNSPGQVVIAGEATAAAKAGELCKEAGAKRALPLPVSVPSHCALMKPAADQLATLFESVSFNAPSLPVVNNVDVAICNTADEIKDALIRQLYSPVRWTETIEWLAGNGVEIMYEVGPGKVLTGLVKRINKNVTSDALNTPASIAEVTA